MIDSMTAADLPDPGEVPALDWIDKTLIDADPLYQRPLDVNRVATILKGFSWKSFGAVVVTPRADGRYSVSDGQHRVEAAKQHPKVSHVPAVIVQAEDVPAEASIFVDINKNRKNVTALELFLAQLAAGDEDAETILQVTSRAGVRIPKYASAGMKANDTIAVAAIQALVGRRGAMRARQYLELLTGAQFAPISGDHIKAVEHVLTDLEFAEHVTAEDLAATIRLVADTADADAKRFAATHRVPKWKGLANVWFKRCRKSKPAAKVAA